MQLAVSIAVTGRWRSAARVSSCKCASMDVVHLSVPAFARLVLCVSLSWPPYMASAFPVLSPVLSGLRRSGVAGARGVRWSGGDAGLKLACGLDLLQRDWCGPLAPRIRAVRAVCPVRELRLPHGSGHTIRIPSIQSISIDRKLNYSTRLSMSEKRSPHPICVWQTKIICLPDNNKSGTLPLSLLHVGSVWKEPAGEGAGNTVTGVTGGSDLISSVASRHPVAPIPLSLSVLWTRVLRCCTSARGEAADASGESARFGRFLPFPMLGFLMNRALP